MGRFQKLTKAVSFYVLSFALIIQQSYPAYAQIAVDGSAPANNQATVTSAPNGVPAINIVRPNASGLSHNKFTDYNVGSQGIILNNSKSIGTSDLGGVMMNNPNLDSSPAASAILNEVTSTNPSTLEGLTEVFGSSAEVIVANPNGITCDGCGFINTPQATLTTGTPQIDGGGSLTNLDIDGGTITVQGDGFDATGNNSKAKFLARAININADIQAGEIEIVSGRNDYDVSSETATAKADNGSTKPSFGVDSTAVGGMYADKITLIGTENGVGFKLDGDMAASVTDLQLNSDGTIAMKNASAAQNISISSNNGDVEIDGRVTADNDVSIQTRNLTATSDTLIQASGDSLTIDATGAVTNNGGVMLSDNDLTINADALNNDRGWIFASRNMTLEGISPGSKMSSLRNISGAIETLNGDLVIRADTFENISDVTVDHETTTIEHAFVRDTVPYVPEHTDYNYPALYQHLYEKRYVSHYVIIPHPDVIDEILAAEDITLADWTANKWQDYLDDALTNNDPARWSIQAVKNFQLDSVSNPRMLFIYEDDVINGSYTAGSIMTIDNGNILLDIGSGTNDKSTISAAGNIDIQGGSLNNVGQTLNSRVVFGPSYQNFASIRNTGWGTLFWPDDQRKIARSEVTGDLAANIAAGGNITGDLSGDVTLSSSPVTAIEDTSFGIGSNQIVRTTDNRNPTLTAYINPARFTPAPISSNYVFETRAQFTDLSSFYGSDYFFSSLTTSFDPDDLPRRLGDAYYDTQAISQQIFNQTGRRNLQGQSVSLKDQMQALLNNGAAFGNSLDLAPGVALTPEQQASLTNNMVWYEEINYKGETVLAPRLYLASLNSDNLPSGASRISAGGNIDIDATNVVSVDGTVQSDQNVKLAAAENIMISGGMIDGQNINLMANDDITIALNATRTGNGENIYGTIYEGPVRLNAEGDITVNSGGNTVFAGADVNAGNALDITAGENISVQTARLSGMFDVYHDNTHVTNSVVKNISSSLTSGGNTNIQALNNVAITGSDISAGNNLTLEAAVGDVTINTAADETYNRFYKNSSSGTRDRVIQSADVVRSTLTSEGDTTLRSGLGNINLQAAEIDSGNNINLEAASGELNVAVAKDLDYYSNVLDRDNGIWVKAVNEGHHHEEIKHTILTGEGDLNITTAEGVTIQYEQTGDLTESINQLSQAPGLAWMADLQNDPNVDWQAVQAINREWSESHEGLSGPAAAVIAIAVAIATNGIGAGLAGAEAGASAATWTTTQIAANAAFTSLSAQAAVSAINNKGNIGDVFDELATSDTVRNLAAAAITAGLVSEFAGGQLQARPENITAPDLANHIKQEFFSGIIRTGVDSTISGQNFSDSLKDNLQFGTAAVFGAQFSQAIGTLIKAGEINKAQQLISHALIGCVSASIGGASCGSAATGSALGEAVSDLAYNGLGMDQQQSAILGRYAALASSLATADEALDVTYSNLAASNAISNNFLLPNESVELAKKIESCDSNFQCKEQVEEPYRSISESRNKALTQSYDACKADANNCQNFFDYHYDIREQLTQLGNEYYLENSSEFTLLPNSKAVYHTYVTDDNGEVINILTEQMNYKKFVHPLLKYEVVVDNDNNIITDPINAGTYNFYNPETGNDISDLIANDDLHKLFDVYPYFSYGNSIDDPTTIGQRNARTLYWLKVRNE